MDASSLSSALRLPLRNSETLPMQVINLGHLKHDSTMRPLAISDIGRACRELGCFQVVNHGVSQPVMKGALDAAAEFFDLSAEAKAEFASSDVQRPVRYMSFKARSFFKHYAHPLGDWIQFWPQEPASYREAMGQYAVEARRVALQLMDAILQSLGLGQAYLSNKLDKGVQVVAVNCYPKASQQHEPGIPVGLDPHSDYGFITILLQSCRGLQVVEHGKKAWTAVPQLPGTLHVHVGDHLEVLSNGQFKTVVHRAVLNPGERRISVASIHGLSMDEKVCTAEELVGEQHPKKYRESSFRDFLHYIPSDGHMERNFIESLRIHGA